MHLLYIFLVTFAPFATLLLAEEQFPDHTLNVLPVDGDNDTVEIRASEENVEQVDPLMERVKRQITTIDSPDGTTHVVVNCKTARNEEGLCKPFKECYPLFLLRSDNIESGRDLPDLDDLDPNKYKTGNFELESIYRNVAGPCDKRILDAISSLGIGKGVPMGEYVCCPSEKNHPTPQPSLPPAPPSPRPEVSGPNKCGKTLVKYKSGLEDVTNANNNDTRDDAPDLRIVNGRVASRGEFPWTVALMNKGRQFCGGSLISNSHILTAAHCVYYMNQNDVAKMKVYIGDHNLYSTADGPSEMRSVSNLYYHKGFNMRTLYDDVSVIRLSQPVTFGRYIQPVCLHQGDTRYDQGTTSADVTGWGQVSSKGRASDILNTVQVRVLSNNECSKTYGSKAPAGIIGTMLCAGGNGKDSCKGDSGGPLTINSHSQAKQIGVVSWGIGCATYPGVYTRVEKYLPWIYKNQR